MPSTSDNSAHAPSDEHVDNTMELMLSTNTASDTINSLIPIRAAHKAPFLQGPPWKRQWNAEQRQLYPQASVDLTHISNIPKPDAPAGNENAADASATAGVASQANATRALSTESSALQSDPTTPSTAVASTSVSPTSASPKAIDTPPSNSSIRSSESPERSPVSAALRVPYNPHNAVFAPVEPYDVHTSLGRAPYSAPHDEEIWRALVEINRAIREGDIPRYTPSPSPTALTSAWDRIPSPVLSEFLDEGDSDKENQGFEVQRIFDPYAETWTGDSNMPRGLYSQQVLSPVLTQSFGADHYGHGSHNEHDIDLHNQEEADQYHCIQLAQRGEQRSPSPAGYEDLSTQRATGSSPAPAHGRVYEMKIYTPEDAQQIYAEYESRKRGRSADSDSDDDEGGRAVKRRRSASPSASTTHHEFNEYDIESSGSSDDEFVASHE